MVGVEPLHCLLCGVEGVEGGGGGESLPPPTTYLCPLFLFVLFLNYFGIIAYVAC
jgi:hypothetical protein